ncbi:MAG: chemotaxis protein CheB, partial [Chroococcidiopsis sp.]
MPGHDIIVIGASAGGVEALSQLLSLLPADIPAAIFVVLHVPSEGYSILPKILNRAIAKRQKQSSLKAIHPQDGEQIEYGRIYVAPPDLHLLVKRGSISLAHGPKENGHRPAVDTLFRTAARAYGQRVVGVVLSGTLDDGTAGLMAVKQRDGVAIVQDPKEAMYSGMPRSAIENVEVDRILPVAEMAALLVELARQPIVTKTAAISDDMEMEADMAELELNAMQNPDRPGTPSPYACPDCGGVLWELDEGRLMRFRCRTGHAYSTDSLLAAQSESLEDALWSALRALEEKAALT